MVRRVFRSLISAQTLCLILVASLLAVGLLHLGVGYGDQLPNRSLTLSTGTVSANDTYLLSFKLPQGQFLGAIKLQFCQESPLLGTPCTAPAGFNDSGAILTSQSGVTDFSISPAGNSSTLIISRPVSQIVANGTSLSYTFNGIMNPSNSGTFYARLQTYEAVGATGLPTDDGGLAMNITDTVDVSAVVPPYLYFCLGISITGVDCSTASGDQLDYGEFSSAIASVAETQMVAGTNADTGYFISMNGTTLTSGNDIIPALATADVSRPGTSQFGVNLRANSDPGIGLDPSGGGVGQPVAAYNTPNLYKFVPGDTVVSVPAPDLPRKYTTSYIANVSKTQVPGIYVSTMTYVATGGF